EARLGLREMEAGRQMTCGGATRGLSDADGRGLRRRGIRAHLRDCSSCPRFRGEIDDRGRGLGALSPVPAGAAGGRRAGALGGGVGGWGGGRGGGRGGGQIGEYVGGAQVGGRGGGHRRGRGDGSGSQRPGPPEGTWWLSVDREKSPGDRGFQRGAGLTGGGGE